MKINSKTFLIILFIGTILAATEEEYLLLSKQVHPILQSFLNPTLNDFDALNLTESLINRALLNPQPEQFYFWTKLLQKKSSYTFFLEQDMINEQAQMREHERIIHHHFGSYSEIGNDKKKCKKFLEQKNDKVEEKLKNIIRLYFTKVLEQKEKHSLYQIIPDGYFFEQLVTLSVNNDIFQIRDVLLKVLSPFYNCIETNPLFIENTDRPNVFVRFWHWLKSIFVKTKEQSQEKTTQESTIFSPISRKQDFEDFIHKIAKNANDQLIIYYDNLKNVYSFLINPSDYLKTLFDAVSMHVELNCQTSDCIFFSRVPLVLKYIEELNIHSTENDQKTVVYKNSNEILQRMSKETFKRFISALENYDSQKPFKLEISQHISQSLMNTLIKLGSNQSIIGLRELFSTRNFPYHQLDETYSLEKSLFFERRLSARIEHAKSSTSFALLFEIISNLPADKSLLYPEQLNPLLVDLFTANLAKFFLVKIINSSRLLISSPDYMINTENNYETILEDYIMKMLRAEGNNGIEIYNFPEIFDENLEKQFDLKNPFVTDNYLFLKIHNAFAVQNKLDFSEVKIREFGNNEVSTQLIGEINDRETGEFKLFMWNLYRSFETGEQDEKLFESGEFVLYFSGKILTSARLFELNTEFSDLYNSKESKTVQKIIEKLI